MTAVAGVVGTAVCAMGNAGEEEGGVVGTLAGVIGTFLLSKPEALLVRFALWVLQIFLILLCPSSLDQHQLAQIHSQPDHLPVQLHLLVVACLFHGLFQLIDAGVVLHLRHVGPNLHFSVGEGA